MGVVCLGSVVAGTMGCFGEGHGHVGYCSLGGDRQGIVVADAHHGVELRFDGSMHLSRLSLAETTYCWWRTGSMSGGLPALCGR